MLNLFFKEAYSGIFRNNSYRKNGVLNKNDQIILSSKYEHLDLFQQSTFLSKANKILRFNKNIETYPNI